ncbi:IS4 family transposase [Halochromatium glycolicum]|nr:IS4 family transposase [Halochromatium glycolicum]
MSCRATVGRFRLKPNAFSRERDLPFARLVTFMLNLCKGSTEQELAGLCSVLDGQAVAGTVPTRAAFSKARKGLSDKLFSHLNRLAIKTFYRGWSTPTWHGFRLRAVDGTTFRLPPGEALERAFGAQRNGPTLARGSILYDIGHDLVLDAQVAATCVGEYELAIEHLAHAEPGDLLIYDRGYPAFWLFALHRHLGIDFCMRLSRSSFAPAQAFFDSAERSRIVTLNPSAEQRRACRDQRVPAEPIRVRLVRVTLRGGETEVLATSVLEEERLPARLFAALYHQRWSAEEHIKRQKRWAEIENFSGRSPLAMRQDIQARILAMNLAAMVRNVAQLLAERRFAHRRFRYQVRACSTLSAMKDNLVRLLLGDGEQQRRLLERLVLHLASAVDAVRPNRSFPRQNPGKLKPGFHPAYKRVA